MDTRSKIIDLPRALALAGGSQLTAVTGHFDIILADHVRALRGLRVIAGVTDPPHPVLERKARVELAASLEAVEYVVPLTAEDREQFLRAYPDCMQQEAEHQRIGAQLARRVWSRHAR